MEREVEGEGFWVGCGMHWSGMGLKVKMHLPVKAMQETMLARMRAACGHPWLLYLGLLPVGALHQWTGDM